MNGTFLAFLAASVVATFIVVGSVAYTVLRLIGWHFDEVERDIQDSDIG